MSRALLVCCDGTWNDAERGSRKRPSNVWRFFEIAAGVEGVSKKYFHGVGVGGIKERFTGLLWGFGIGDLICEAYAWLATQYREGDRIFLVGFSRGAFTVRSLAGMIGLRGFPRGDEVTREGAASEYEAYRRREASGRAIPRIQFVGVFDTVGKLGVPDERWIANFFDRPKRWAFHDTQLGDHVAHGRHAIAIDEQRAEFMPTLWVGANGEPIYDFNKDDRSVRQLWFSGRHSDVGGEFRPIANMALSWMLKEAQRCGLPINKEALAALELDSLAKIGPRVGGLFKLMPRGVPALRACGAPRPIHPSVFARRKKDAVYWPTKWLGATGTTCVVFSDRGTQWQPTGIWIANGRRFVARASPMYGARGVRGFVANGGNPGIDGTWPEHEEFALNKPVAVSRGGGYLYFRVFRVATEAGGKAAAWHRMNIEVAPLDR